MFEEEYYIKPLWKPTMSQIWIFKDPPDEQGNRDFAYTKYLITKDPIPCIFIIVLDS